jgi:hypothetical protein
VSSQSMSPEERLHHLEGHYAFAGYDPISDGSGDRPDRVGHLSKRGDPAFCDSFYCMG